MKRPEPLAAIVLLNWNRWDYTVACLESLLKLEYTRYAIIVCDNASSDGSMEHIVAWAAGSQTVPASPPAALRHLVEPPVTKPVECRVLDRASAESTSPMPPTPLTVIQTGANLGFAGGCNVGIRHAMTVGADYVWLLNNDTVVTPASLRTLVAHAETHPDVALCGSTLLSLHEPSRVLALGGGRLHRKGTTEHIGEGQQWPVDPKAASAAAATMDYVVGASMLARRPFIAQTGLMDEGYFLYYEELDWARRMPRHMRLGYAPQSVVYHVEGASTGGLLLRYYYRSLIRFTWRCNRAWLPWVLVRMLLRVPEALYHRDRAKLRALASLLRPMRTYPR